MEQVFSTLKIKSSGKGFNDITDKIREFLCDNNFSSGIIILNLLHTSCSLTINENADPNVLKDLERYIEGIVPYNCYQDLTNNKDYVYYEHFQEGEDDMPAHIKTALTNNSLSLSFQNEKLILGTWQSIYIWEHRFHIKERKLNLHIIGEKRKNTYN